MSKIYLTSDRHGLRPEYTYSDAFTTPDSSSQLNLAARHCPILVEARKRYLNRMFPGFSFDPEAPEGENGSAAENRATVGNLLRGMKIVLAEASENQYNCENSPYLGMNETCELQCSRFVLTMFRKRQIFQTSWSCTR